MSYVWKRLPDRRASGAWQMAADDWMLSRAEAGECLFRVYEFEAPTVSLGYFQSWERLKSVPSLARLPWVRRQTGGDLLVHDNEITYAIAAPVEALGVVRDLPCRVHRAVSEWLKTLGIETQCQPEAGKISREGAPAGILCFLHPAAGDVLFQGCKVMGSAQRKRHGAVLQHGSLLLGTCPAAPWLPGLTNLGATIAGIGADGLAQCLEVALGSKAGLRSWCDEAEIQIRELATSRYSNSEWNKAR